MGALATLSQPDLVVVPGQSVSVVVNVQNNGTVVDEYSIYALGDAAGWVTADPPSLSLYPGTTGEITVSFTPPRSSDVQAGYIPFGLQVMSREDPTGSVVEEGMLEVSSYADPAVELLPRTSKARGRRRAKHELAIDNRGNAPIDVLVTPSDPTEKLEIELDRPGIRVEAGQAAFLPLSVRGRKRFWRGAAKTHQFQLLTESGTAASPLVVEGAFLQEAAIPKWLGRLLALLLLLALLAVTLWFTVLKPAVKDAAKDQAAKTAAAVGAQAGKDAGAKAGGDAAKAAQPSVVPSVAPSPTPAAVATPEVANGGLGDPVFLRLAATADQQSPFRTFGAKELFSLTDIVLENPRGDEGEIALLRTNADGTVDTLLDTNLADFRDLDYHFVAPLVFAPNSSVTLKTTCTTPGNAGKVCSPAVSISGYTRAPAKASASPQH